MFHQPSVQILFRSARVSRSVIAPRSAMSSSGAPTAEASAQPAANGGKSASLTMQIIIRRDLIEPPLSWPMGPLMAQASHAATAVLETHKDEEAVKLYLSDVPNMRKAVLQTPTGESLSDLSRALETASPSIKHYLWMEEPEHIPTALAIVPNKREKRLKKLLDAHQVELWK